MYVRSPEAITTIDIMDKFIAPKSFFLSLCDPSFLTLVWFSLLYISLHFLQFDANGLIQHVSFLSDLFLFLNVIIMSFINFVACVQGLFLSKLLNNIQSRNWTTACLPVHLLKGIGSCLAFGYCKYLSWTVVKPLCRHTLSYFLSKYLEVEWLDQTIGIS